MTGQGVSKMTTQDMEYQDEVLRKYRDSGIIPTMVEVKKKTGISTTTIAAFMHGTSTNKVLRDYIRLRFEKNLKPLPEDVLKLLEIWQDDTSA